MRKPTSPDDRTLALYQEIQSRKRILRRFRLSDSDIDDIAQNVFLRCRRVLSTIASANLAAYVSRALRNEALDLRRTRSKRPVQEFSDEEEFAKAIDGEAGATTEGATELAQREHGWWTLLDDLRVYEERANEGRYRRGHHIRAWWRVRLEGDDGAEVGTALGAASVDAVWQWCKRGAALVTELANADDDRERAARMRCAVHAAARAA